MRIYFPWIPLAVAVAVAGCGSGPSTPRPPEAAAAAADVRIGPVAEIDAPLVYEATGTVRAQFNATLSSKVMARVASVRAREGDAVRKGAVLVSLDARELQAGVQVAASTLNASAVGIDSAKTVEAMEQKTSAARIRQAEAAATQARAALSMAQANLELVLAGPRTQERSQARLAVVQAESTLRQAKSQLDRVSSLVQQGAMAKRELDVAQNAYEVALAQRDIAVQAEKIAQEGSRTEEVRSAREAVAAATAAVGQADANVAHARAGALQTDVRSQEVRSARSQRNLSAAALESAKVLLSYATVVAPFDGRVVRRQADPGAMALPGSPLMEIEGGTLRLELTVPESVLPRLKVGDALSVTIDALATPYRARVVEIAPQGDPASHTFTVRAALEGAEGVRSGMFGRARIETGRTRRIEVPASAVWEREGLHYAFVVNPEGLARLRLLTVGERAGENLVVLSGLAPGERIVVEGREAVVDGAKVNGR